MTQHVFLRAFASFSIISFNSTCIPVKGEWESHKNPLKSIGNRERGEGDREGEREGRWRELERGRNRREMGLRGDNCLVYQHTSKIMKSKPK